ncbi:MAG: hypothetical protein JWR87_1023 [Segetibacter sp.]|nr:hypothetical protein [Segetibacter sp.]
MREERYYYKNMNFIKSILNKNPAYFFLLKFLFTFFTLYFFFPFYRGVIAPGGQIYFPYFESHFNLVTSLTSFLTCSAKFLLEAAGFDIFQNNYQSLRIGYSKGVTVNPSCLGWAVMSFWVAFVFANKGALQYKLKWMTFGLVAVFLLNITRIALIAVANHLNWQPITSLDHHQTFNVASYVCIAILIGWYISVQKKYERINSAGQGSEFVAI